MSCRFWPTPKSRAICGAQYIKQVKEPFQSNQRALGGKKETSMTSSSRKVQYLSCLLRRGSNSCFQRFFAAKTSREHFSGSANDSANHNQAEDCGDVSDVPTSGISRPLSEILKELNKKVPDSLIRLRTEADGFSVKYIPWSVGLPFSYYFFLVPFYCVMRTVHSTL